MKAVGVVLSVLLAVEAAWCHFPSDKDKQALKKCAAENNVKFDDFKPFFEEKDISKDAKCFFKCVMMEFGTLKEDGTIEVEQHLKETGHEEFLATAGACLDIEKNDDLCEMAYQHGVCVLKKDTDGKMKEDMSEFLEKI